LVTKETKGINLPVFENSLENFRSSSFEELMIFTLRDKAGNAKADKLQKEELVAYSQALLEKVDNSEKIPTNSYLYRKKADRFVKVVVDALEEKQFYPEILAYELSELLYEAQYQSIFHRIKSWFTRFSSDKDFKNRNFTINLWTNSIRDVLRVYGVQEKELKWYRKMWTHLIRASLSISLNQISLSTTGVFVDGFTYKNLDLKKFYETEDLFSLSVKDLRDIYFIKVAALEKKHPWSLKSLRMERIGESFTKIIHRTAVVLISLTVLYHVAPYELVTKDRVQVEEEIIQIYKAIYGKEFDEALELQKMDELTEKNFYSLIHHLRQKQKELEQVEKKSIF
tara:strand:+ start:1654 stop:2673 length:1020 start_codon:yes stop_codon:yes gene_type:complete